MLRASLRSAATSRPRSVSCTSAPAPDQVSALTSIMSLLQTVVRRSVVWSLAAFYAFTVIVSLVTRTLFRPSRQFWFLRKRVDPPAVLTDPKLGVHKFLQLKNIKLHYVENGDNSKPLMLFLHGFPEFWYSWRHQIKEFSKDYWTIALDMRGYGDSDKPSDVKSYKLKFLVRDVKELVEALGRDKFILVAHDWGGVVAWQFLFHFPEMVERYVIMDAPHPRGFRKYVISSPRQFLRSWYLFFFQTPYIPELYLRAYDLAVFKRVFRKYRTGTETKVTDEDIEAYKYVYSQIGSRTGPINYYRANFGSMYKLKPNEDKDLPPGLFICGEKDDALSQDLLSRVKQLIPSCSFEVIKNANHYVQQDDPEAVNKTIRNFFNKGEIVQKNIESVK